MQVRDFRKQVIFYCAHDNAYMGLVQGKYGIYYRCEKYFFQKREPGERVCTNYLSLDGQDHLYEELSRLEEKDLLKKGAKGVVDSVYYEIAEINDELIKVKIHNARSGKGRKR